MDQGKEVNPKIINESGTDLTFQESGYGGEQLNSVFVPNTVEGQTPEVVLPASSIQQGEEKADGKRTSREDGDGGSVSEIPISVGPALNESVHKVLEFNSKTLDCNFANDWRCAVLNAKDSNLKKAA